MSDHTHTCGAKRYPNGRTYRLLNWAFTKSHLRSFRLMTNKSTAMQSKCRKTSSYCRCVFVPSLFVGDCRCCTHFSPRRRAHRWPYCWPLRTLGGPPNDSPLGVALEAGASLKTKGYVKGRLSIRARGVHFLGAIFNRFVCAARNSEGQVRASFKTFLKK